MILNSDAKFKEKLTCSFKHDMRNLINFHPIKSLKISPRRALFVQSIKAWDKKNKEELSLMTLKGGAKCKWKLTCGLKNDKEFCYFSCEQLKVWKFALDGFLLSKTWSFRWKSTEELSLMTLESDAKFEEKLALDSWFHDKFSKF